MIVSRIIDGYLSIADITISVKFTIQHERDVVDVFSLYHREMLDRRPRRVRLLGTILAIEITTESLESLRRNVLFNVSGMLDDRHHISCTNCFLVGGEDMLSKRLEKIGVGCESCHLFFEMVNPNEDVVITWKSL